MIRHYSIHLLVQEEPESGKADDREVLVMGCPSFGQIDFASDKDDPTELFNQFKEWFNKNTSPTINQVVKYPRLN
jgi:hypothetical protein